MAKDNYFVVDITKLKPNELQERSLYLHFPSNDRYFLVHRGLHPLEPRIYEKIVSIGKVYSNEDDISERNPRFQESLSEIQEILANDSLALFEKQNLAFKATDWIVGEVFSTKQIAWTSLVSWVHQAFDLSSKEDLLKLHDISVEAYETGIKSAALAGILALWFGYTNKMWLQKFVKDIFLGKKSSRTSGGFSGDEAAAIVGFSFSFVKSPLLSLLKAEPSAQGRVARKLIAKLSSKPSSRFAAFMEAAA